MEHVYAVDNRHGLLSPAGARAVTCPFRFQPQFGVVAVPRRGASCYIEVHCRFPVYCVAVPRRGASCYHNQQTDNRPITHRLLSPAGARAVTEDARIWLQSLTVAVPRRGASCYKQNFPTFVSSRRCCPRRGASRYAMCLQEHSEFMLLSPAGVRVVTYCYYNTRFAPNQPVSKPSSIATGCKTQRHKL